MERLTAFLIFILAVWFGQLTTSNGSALSGGKNFQSSNCLRILYIENFNM